MNRRLKGFALVWLWLCCTTVAWAKDSVLQQVPEDALAVVVIKSLSGASAKIESLAKQMQMPAAPPLLMLKSITGLQEGVDETGSVGLAVLSGEGFPAAAVMLVPVSDYAKFLAQLKPTDAKAKVTEATLSGEAVLVGDADGYAALTSPQFRSALEHVLASKKDVSGEFKGIQAWLDENDVFAAATPAGLKLALQQASQGLEQAKGAFPKDNDQADMVLKTFETYQNALTMLEREATHLAIGLRIDSASAVHLGSRIVFAEGGSIDKMATLIKAPATSPFTGLPAGPFAMAFGGATPEALFVKMMDWSATFMKSNPLYGNLDEEQAKELAKSMADSVKGMESMAIVMGAGKPGDSLYSNATGLIKVKDSAAFIAQYKKAIASMGKIMVDPESKIAVYTVRDLKVGGAPGLEITMDMSSMIKGPQAELMKGMFEKMIGPGGKMNMYVAAVDKKTVAIAYVSKEKLNQLIVSYKSGKPGLAADPDVAKTHALLPKGSQWVAYISPKGFVEFINSVMSTVAPEGGMQAPPFPQTPPIGMGARLDGDGLETDLVVPAKLLQAAAQYAAQLQNLRQAPPPDDAL